MRKRKRYGYKVCYKEEGERCYTRHFKTYTYRQAVQVLNGFVRYPPLARGDGHKLVKPKWKIIPINRKEVERGIWRECPF